MKSGLRTGCHLPGPLGGLGATSRAKHVSEGQQAGSQGGPRDGVSPRAAPGLVPAPCPAGPRDELRPRLGLEQSCGAVAGSPRAGGDSTVYSPGDWGHDSRLPAARPGSSGFPGDPPVLQGWPLGDAGAAVLTLVTARRELGASCLCSNMVRARPVCPPLCPLRPPLRPARPPPWRWSLWARSPPPLPPPDSHLRPQNVA